MTRGRKLGLLLLALAVNVLTALYAAGSATVYYWDSNIYWSSSTMLAGQRKRLPLQFLPWTRTR